MAFYFFKTISPLSCSLGKLRGRRCKMKESTIIACQWEEVFDIVDNFAAEQKGGNNEADFRILAKSLINYVEPKRHVTYETFKLDKKGNKTVSILTYFVRGCVIQPIVVIVMTLVKK